MNHRLELALADAVDEVGGVNHFQIFMDKLYTLYSRSPMNQRQLADCAGELDQQINKIGRILSTRWVASSFRTIAAIWFAYSSLFSHFSKAKEDMSRTSTDRNMYNGLLKRLSSRQFLLDLAIMYDILAEISMLSEALQHKNTTVFYADKLIRRCIRFIESLKEKPGTRVLEAKIAIKEGTFCSISLIDNPKMSSINQQQLLSSVANNLKCRLFTTISSHESRSASSDDKRNGYETLLDELKVLESDQWPSDIPIGYGEREVERLCKRFKLNASKVKNDYRDYLDNSMRVPKELNRLINCSKLIPCSSAECERGFSMMNNIISATRTRLLIPHVASLLFIKLHGPPLSDWDPEPYVTTWLRTHRSADDTRTRVAKRPGKSSEFEDNVYANLL